MPRDNLGSKQTIVLRDSLIKNERYDLLITMHRQTIGHNRSKDKHVKKIITKQRQIIKGKFLKRRNAVSQPETNTIKELQNMKDSVNENDPTENQKFFYDAEAATPSSI